MSEKSIITIAICTCVVICCLITCLTLKRLPKVDVTGPNGNISVESIE